MTENRRTTAVDHLQQATGPQTNVNLLAAMGMALVATHGAYTHDLLPPGLTPDRIAALASHAQQGDLTVTLSGADGTPVADARALSALANQAVTVAFADKQKQPLYSLSVPAGALQQVYQMASQPGFVVNSMQAFAQGVVPAGLGGGRTGM